MSEAQTVLKLDGIVCNGCVSAVQEALQAVEGVTEVDVSLEQSQAVIKGGATPDSLVKAVEQAGYGAQISHG